MASRDARDCIPIAAGDARVEIAPATGGSLASFTVRGIDVLRPTPSSARAERNVRAHASYPLVPYSNRIAQAYLITPNHEYALPKNFGDHPHSIHGVGWQREWHVEAMEDDHALLTLAYSPHDDSRDAAVKTPAWPWAFRALQSFALSSAGDAARLMMRLTLTNTSDAAFPFGLGWHPFFPRTANTRLGFTAGGVWETDGTQLPTRHVTVPADWRFDPAQPVASRVIDNVFTGWLGSATVSDAERHIAVTLEADRSCRFLVVYIPADRDYLAVEPVTHMTDAFNRAARGEAGTGTRMLRPGDSFSTTIRLSVRFP